MDVQVRYIGGNCPVQAEGTIGGEPFYFRARGDAWEIGIGPEPVDITCGFREGFHHEERYGDGPYDAGWMDVEEARAFIDQAAKLYAESLAALQAQKVNHE